MRRHAACLIPGPPHYGRELFLAGLKAAGFEIGVVRDRPASRDVLVIWNRRRNDEAYVRRYEECGAAVVVVENGYLGADDKPPHWYAMALGHHNGRGVWRVGAEDRWSRLAILLSDWRRDGEHILVLPQRSIGEVGVAMPAGWAADVERRLRRLTARPIKVRAHPGKRPHPPLDPDLAGCWAVVTWGSGAALKAIVAGVPCFHELRGWIGAPAAREGIADVERPCLGDRLPMLHRLAWSQWSASEITRGEPFEWLLKSPSGSSTPATVPA